MDLKDKKDLFLRSSKVLILAIFISFISYFLFYWAEPELDALIELFNSKFGDLDINSHKDAFFLFIKNNGFFVPLQTLFFALLPIPFLYYLNVVITSLSVGLMFFMVTVLNNPMFTIETAFAGILPHYFFEMFGFAIIVVLVSDINKAVVRKFINFFRRIFRREEKEDIPFKENFQKAIRGYLFLALPLIVFAAFVEAFITPFFMSLF